MKIEGVHWLSQSAEEAEVIVTDGVFHCMAYSQPCSASAGDDVLEPLYVFGIRKAILIEGREVGSRRIQGPGFAQNLVVKVMSCRLGLLSIGGIELVAGDPLPGGLEDGDIIEIDCARVDLW
ncbi:hypothetical protein [Aquidulcibacter sp.]|uniref:hypothetical protein n=1 Tax=Aquidulcibacter sp. TaxID=2052990 RepID=UPI003BA7F5C8